MAYLANVVPITVTADSANGLMPIREVASGGVPVQVTTETRYGLVPCEVVAEGGVPVVVMSGSLT